MTNESKRPSGYELAKQRAEAAKRSAAVEAECNEAGVLLAVAYQKAKGTQRQRELDPDVIEAKVRLTKALNARDSDPSQAVLAALDALQIKKNAAPTWLFGSGVAKPDSK